MRIRLTKYNPVFRHSDGHYRKDEWTCPSEINKVNNGKVILSATEYLHIEDNYVRSIIDILALFEIDELEIDGFELYIEDGEFISCVPCSSSLSLLDKIVNDVDETLKDSTRKMIGNLLEVGPIQNGLTISRKYFGDAIRLCLRHVMWYRLVSTDGTYIHYGGEFYVFMGTNKQPKRWTVRIPEGIFVEFFPSPYSEDESEDGIKLCH